MCGKGARSVLSAQRPTVPIMHEPGEGDGAASASSAAAAWLRVPAPGAWVEDAACARVGAPLRDVFTQEAPSVADREAAQHVCRGCPVVAACGSYGREARGWGTWGGHLLRNGRELAQRLRQTA